MVATFDINKNQKKPNKLFNAIGEEQFQYLSLNHSHPFHCLL